MARMEISTLSVMAWPGRNVSACNLKCPYCVSRMTHQVEAKEQTMVPPERLAFLADKFLRVCAGIPYGIITGKGEPTLTDQEALGEIFFVLRNLSGHQRGLVPELQTNGTRLTPENMAYWHGKGLNTVAISCVSHVDQVNSQILSQGKLNWELGRIVREAKDIGLLVRLTVILTKGGLDNPDGFLAFMNWAQQVGAHQVTFRKMGTPRNLALPGSQKVAQWIDRNYVDPKFILEALQRDGELKDQWPWATRFAYKGISTLVTECMNDPDQQQRARHSVIQPDGGLYLSWDDPTSRII